MPRGNPNGPPNRPPLPNGPGHGRTKGAKNKLTKERLEQEIKYLALSNIIDAFEGIHGNKRRFTLRELRAMPEAFQRCIASVKVRTENLTPGDDAQDTTIEIKLWDKPQSQALAAKVLGMVKDHIVVEGLDARKERLRRALAKPPEET